MPLIVGDDKFANQFVDNELLLVIFHMLIMEHYNVNIDYFHLQRHLHIKHDYFTKQTMA